MLKQLRIQNLILLEKADIPFTSGLNVLSGETGSGKSAIVAALNLLAGERSDPDLVRHGEERGMVEALFEVGNQAELFPLLEAAGIQYEEGEDLLIKRELSSQKNRIFINHQLAQLSLLRKIGEILFETVGQHANRKLFALDNHRAILDLWGDLVEEQKAFSKSWQKEQALLKELHHLTHTESERLRKIEVCRMELKELEEAAIREGEEESLFTEYTLLNHTEELSELTHHLTEVLSGEKSLIKLLQKHHPSFAHLIKIDPSLTSLFDSYQNALEELKEISYALGRYEHQIERDPDRIAIINERLSLLNSLKKRYGASVEQILQYKEEVSKKLLELESADSQIETLQEEIKKLEAINENLANALTKKRKEVAKKLEREIASELAQLNMPQAEFKIDLSPQKRGEWGDDKVEFFLAPNRGERSLAIRDYASGGELARVLLALQTLLAGKQQIPILIFDEIDAHIGGTTAAAMAEKLEQMGQKHQVLCITHFPQVARQANHHLQISKQEVNGRTLTTIKVLNKKEKLLELQRMLGKNAPPHCT